MNISIKREQSQTGLSFAGRENQRSTAEGKVKFRPQVKKIFFLLVLLCAMTTQRAWADQEYITDVIVIGCNDDDDADDLYRAYQNQGWIGIGRDLNDGAGGYYIYLMYKTNNSPGSSGTAINDMYLRVSGSNDAPASLVYNGRTYYRAGADGDNEFKRLGGDLNCEAGGAYIVLYYTKDFGSIARVTSISINGSAWGAVGENGSVSPCDLNKSAGGSDIFLHIVRQVADNVVNISNEAELHEAVLFDGGILRLAKDINLSRAVGITGGSVHLDLNGHTLNRGLKSAQDHGSVIGVDPSMSLTISDASDNPYTPEYDGTGTITGGYTNQDGGGICNYGRLTIYGANIKGNAARGNGGGIFTGKLAGVTYTQEPQLRINAGVIENYTSDGNGGAICQGNNVGDSYVKKCIIRNNVSKKGGGAIFNEGKNLEVTNSTISVNTAFDTGGIYSKYGIVTVTGCTVTSNIGTDGAGGIANETTSANMTVSGCTVTDNFAGTRGGGLWNSGTLSLDGNTITGNIASGNGGGIYNATTLNMKGKPVVTDNTGNNTANNLYLDNSKPITVTGAFAEGASIGISMEDKNAAITSGYTTHNADKDPAGIFTSDNDYSIVLNNNEVYQYYISDVATDAEIQAAMEVDAIVKLTADITLSKQLTIGAGRTVTIDLNGHKLQRNVLENDWYNMVIHNFGMLTINDSKYDQEATATNGQITGGRAHGGGGIYCEDGSKLFFNGGTITGNTATTRDGAGGIGGAIFVQHGAEATIKSGVITGNSAERGGAIFVAANGKLNVGHAYYNENSATYGGCIYNEANGTLNFNGGFLKGNSATYGGCVYNEANGTLNIHTCYISNNTATSNGGGILNKGNLYMHPGFPEVHNNTANGISNNLYLDAGTKINVTGEFAYPAVIYVSGANVNTAITSGYSTYNAGLRIDSYFKPDFGYDIYMKDNELYLGVAKNVDVSNEAQLFAVAGMDSHITLADDITLSKQLTINAGRTVTIDLNGHKLQRNVTENAQYNMVIDNFGSLTIDDGSGTNSGQITGGRATYGGGICCEAGSTLTFNGGTITGNMASNAGGGIYVKDGATANVTGGVITGNTAITNGGGIYDEGTLNMQGNPIVSDNHNGSALNNLYLTAGKTVNVTGAFTKGASIGISAANTNVAITSGYKKYNAGKDPATVFTDDNEGDDAKISLIDSEVYLVSSKGVNVATYTQLMAAVINNANIKLTADITLAQEVTIQNNKIVTIDLNGHTLNRNLTAAADKGHVLTVASGSQLTINDSSDNPDTPEYDGTGVIKGAYTANGGAIDNAGTLIFNAGTIKDNQCTDKGAAIWNRSGATATITGGVIKNNKATNKGAGIWNEGTLCMQGNPIVSGNKSGNTNRNVYLCGGKPISVTGAFTTGASIPLTLEQRSAAITSGFNNDNAGTDPATIFKAENGLTISLKGNEVYQFKITNVKSSDELNAAVKTNAIITVTADFALKDQIIFADNVDVTIDLNGHIINRNKARTDRNNLVEGHALNINRGATLTINDSSDNPDTPEYDGTGVIKGGNGDNGGAIWSDGTLIINGGTIKDSYAEMSGKGNGGGIYVNAGSTATINGGVITGNSALQGGGIYNDGTLTIGSNVTIANNTANDGSGIYNNGTLTITGGSITANKATTAGGGIYNNGNINLSGGNITANTSQTSGGGIYNSSTLNISDNAIIANNTANDGGGIHNSGTLNITDGSITANTVTTNGGGIYNNGTLTISDNVTIANNKAKDGGAIFTTGGTLNINGGSITGNQATNRGGAIYNNGNINMSGGSITANTSQNDGGGIYNGATLNMQGNPVVSGNTSTDNGTDNIFVKQRIYVIGAFTEGAKIGLYDDDDSKYYGKTFFYSDHNAGMDPNNFFFSDLGYTLTLNSSGDVTYDLPGDGWIDHNSTEYTHRNGSTYFIENEAELAFLAYNVMNGKDYEGCTFILNKDLEMSAHLWTPIGSESNRFKGSFDGGGHRINGLYIDSGDYVGLFGYVEGDVKLSNLVMTNATTRGNENVGCFVGYVDGQAVVENILCQAYVRGSNNVGGIVGSGTSGATVQNCVFMDGKIEGKEKVGTIIGNIGKDMNLSRNYYLNPAVLETSQCGVCTLAYPVTESHPEGVTINYDLSGDGVIYNDVLYYPAKTLRFTVDYTMTNDENVSIEVNGTKLGMGPDTYSYTIDPAKATAYEINVKAVSTAMAGTGTEADPYMIKSDDDWYIFEYRLKNGIAVDGMYYKLATDMSVSNTLGSEEHAFKGHFDGAGHRITLAFGSAENYLNEECALFYRLENATIENLIVDGSIFSSAMRNSSLAVKAAGNGNRIRNCASSVSINSNKDGDCTNGGFIGLMNTDGTKVWFEGCAFFGELVGEKASNWGGFVGWREYQDNNFNTVSFTDCIFDPAKVNIATPDGTNSRTFCRSRNKKADGASYKNCYYWTSLQEVDGGKEPYTITADEGITVENAGTVTEYNLSGIISYGGCIIYNNVLYSGNGNKVSLNLSGNPTGYYHASTGSLSGTKNPYTLMMGNGNCVISVWDTTAPTTIASLSDWNEFLTAVNNRHDYEGETVTLATDDIVVNAIIGSADSPFRGTFEGGGHRITLAFGSKDEYLDEECALFYSLENATIQNLAVNGSIYSSTQHNATLAVKAAGNENRIRNCVSSVSINSNKDGDCTNGGFIALMNTDGTKVWFEGCAFLGQLVGEKASNWGGFVGWRAYQDNNFNTVSFTDCLFAPAKASIARPSGSNSRKFCRSTDNTTEGASYNNSYFMTTLFVVDGGKLAYSITSGKGVTVENAGTVTEYNVSGITGYGVGIKYKDVLYAGPDDQVSLNLSGFSSGYYHTSTSTLSGTKNPYTLTMGSGNCVIAGWDVAPPTTIASLTDWNYFQEYISYGYDYGGETVTLATDDIVISTVTGSTSYPFRGTFDGGGHKITLAFGSPDNYLDQECALFACLADATIQNLVIDGSIYSSAPYNASIVSRSRGYGNRFRNCVSRVSVNAYRDGQDCHSGGFIGIIDAGGSHVYFDGCAFAGELRDKFHGGWGGFVGYKDRYWYNHNPLNIAYNYVHFTDCLFAPTIVSISSNTFSTITPNCTFCRADIDNRNNCDYNNCYYTTSLDYVDGGSQVNLTTTNPVDMGEVKTDYGLVTVYAHGMKCNGRYHITAEAISLADNADNSALISEKHGQSAYVMLSDRTLYTDGDWNTICLPFDVTLDNSPLQGAEASTLSEATFNDGTLTLNFGEPVETLTAGTPYIMKWKETSAKRVIRTAADWDAFAQALKYNNLYSGKLVVLDADIEVSTIIGDEGHRFQGTFDGRGHTLTFNSNANEHYCAPFHHVDGATIKNLHVKGTINTSEKFAAGIVGHAKGNVTISNCRSSIVINSTVKGDGTHGGLVAMTNNENTNLTLTDCLFDGSINGAETNSCSGMIGWNDCIATLTNCVVRPAGITLDSESNATFSRGSNVTVNNCYYSENLPGASGQGTAIGTMTNKEQAAALGNEWLVENGEVVPDMTIGSRIIDPVFKGVTINAAEPARITPGLASGTDGDGCVTFCGIYDPVTIGPEGDNTKLYFSTKNTLYWPNGAMTINPFRAYLQLNSTAAQTRSIVLNIGDERTEIEVKGVNGVLGEPSDQGRAKEVKDDAWYDMSGRRLDGKPTAKGFYINNGKKVVIK